MADHSTCPPLTRQSVQAAHKRIEPYIHRTPVVTCSTLDHLASTPQAQRCPSTGPNTASEPAPHGPTKDNSNIASYTAKPTVRLFFKSENQQKIGAFKARGAFHALGRLIDENGIDSVRARGVVTHSSGNHAQALAFAAKTFAVPAHIAMPTISTPSKIAGTKSHGAAVVFSGSTSEEREKVTQGIIDRTGATLIPPYDHPDIILGAGTQALELEEQAMEILQTSSTLAGTGEGSKKKTKGLDAVIAPIGGGGMLSGICTALHGTGIRVYGAEPSFEGANDAERGLAQNSRIEQVKTLTIADGLRTPVGEIPWSIISDKEKLAGIYSVSEDQIKAAMRLALERMKVFIEPSAAVGLAVMLYHEGFREMVERE
ncbi:tryptophan synthase beta subunit-like PLP-dependent enzyme, partial [Hortaea werneckii]